MEAVTAAQIVEMFQGLDGIAVLINLIAFVGGLLLNVYNKCTEQEISFKEYWAINGKRSIASLSTLFVSFAFMTLSGTAPIYAYFSMAYLNDAVINKAKK